MFFDNRIPVPFFNTRPLRASPTIREGRGVGDFLAPSSNRIGRWLLKPEMRVRFPSGLLLVGEKLRPRCARRERKGEVAERSIARRC